MTMRNVTVNDVPHPEDALVLTSASHDDGLYTLQPAHSDAKQIQTVGDRFAAVRVATPLNLISAGRLRILEEVANDASQDVVDDDLNRPALLTNFE